MFQRKLTVQLYPNAKQEARLIEMLELHLRLYNTALEERKRVYETERRSVSHFEQNKELTQWRRQVPALAGMNAQSEQVTLKRVHLAFQHFFRRLKNGEKPGFPRYKTLRCFRGWGYASHGDGWKLHQNEFGKHGKLYLQSVGNIPIRGKSRNMGEPSTCEIFRKQGKWYASITLKIEQIHREPGTEMGAFDWGVETYLTIATVEGVETIDNPRHLRNQLAELKRLGRDVSRKIRMAQQLSGKKRGFPVSRSLRRAMSLLARLHAKIARQRKDFLHQTSAWLISRFGALATEALDVTGMLEKRGKYKNGKRNRGLRREIQSAAPSGLLTHIRNKAAEAGSWYEEAPTVKLKPSQRCHACGRLPWIRKSLSERKHQCPHCGETCGRDENAALVLFRWLETQLAGVSGSGREPSEVWS